MKAILVLVFCLSVATAQTGVGLAQPTTQGTETATVAAPSTTLSKEGWGKTKWGMTHDEVKAIYPTLTVGTRVVGLVHERSEELPMLPEYIVTGTFNDQPHAEKFRAFFSFDGKKGLRAVYLDSLSTNVKDKS